VRPADFFRPAQNATGNREGCSKPRSAPAGWSRFLQKIGWNFVNVGKILSTSEEKRRLSKHAPGGPVECARAVNRMGLRPLENSPQNNQSADSRRKSRLHATAAKKIFADSVKSSQSPAPAANVATRRSPPNPRRHIAPDRSSGAGGIARLTGAVDFTDAGQGPFVAFGVVYNS